MPHYSHLPPIAPTATLPATTVLPSTAASAHACHCRDAWAELLADNAPAALNATSACRVHRLCSSGRLIVCGPPAMSLEQAHGDKVPARAAPSMSAARCSWLLTLLATSLARPCLLQCTHAPDAELTMRPHASATRLPQNAPALTYKKGHACNSSTHRRRCHSGKLPPPHAHQVSVVPCVPNLLTPAHLRAQVLEPPLASVKLPDPLLDVACLCSDKDEHRHR
jgi:hypothetical protein